MKNFKITHIHISETYDGVFCCSNLRDLNKLLIDEIEETVAICFGDDRKIYKDIEYLDLNKRLPKYFFIAWLANDNKENISDEMGSEYDGFDLFIVGYEDNLDNVIGRVREIGKEKFSEESVGFFY